MIHASHDNVCKRLKRAYGHLGRVIRMLEDGRDCPEIARQIYAVEQALTRAKRLFIHDHLEGCLEAALHEGGDIGGDVREITRYL